MIIFTSICNNYLPKAIVLANSVKKYFPSAKFIAVIVEKSLPIGFDPSPFDNVVFAKDLGFEDFNKFIFRHAIVEASTSVKGQSFRYFLKEYPNENTFIYFDPDIVLYSEPIELIDALRTHPVVLTPHLTIPEKKDSFNKTIQAIEDNELCALQHGVYNLGFLAITRTEDSVKFIDWWAERLSLFCYDDIPRGIFTDQRWIDLAPCFFDVFILKHPGYNTAPWNVSMRDITKEAGEYLVNGLPLRFFHYSGFDSGANLGMLDRYVPEHSNSVFEIRNNYIKDQDSAGQEKLTKEPWSYGIYDDGKIIETKTRRVLRKTFLDYRTIPINPFVSEKETMKFAPTYSRLRKGLSKIKKVILNRK